MQQREEAAAEAMNVDEDDDDMDFLRLNERLLIQHLAAEAAGNDEGEELADEPEPEQEKQIDDDENDPQRLNIGEERRKRVTQCEFYSFLMSIRPYLNTTTTSWQEDRSLSNGL